MSAVMSSALRIYQFSLIPEFVFRFFRRRNAANEEFIVLNMKVQKLDFFVIRRGKKCLILLLEFVETLLSALLLLSIGGAASEHLVKSPIV